MKQDEEVMLLVDITANNTSDVQFLGGSMSNLTLLIHFNNVR